MFEHIPYCSICTDKHSKAHRQTRKQTDYPNTGTGVLSVAIQTCTHAIKRSNHNLGENVFIKCSDLVTLMFCSQIGYRYAHTAAAGSPITNSLHSLLLFQVRGIISLPYTLLSFIPDIPPDQKKTFLILCLLFIHLFSVWTRTNSLCMLSSVNVAGAEGLLQHFRKLYRSSCCQFLPPNLALSAVLS